MSDQERTGRRDLLYSRWHRPEHISRFFEGGLIPRLLKMIDLDAIEYCARCRKVLALIETKNSSNDPEHFPSYITAGLAGDASVPAFTVCYTCRCGITGDKHETKQDCDIAEFRVQQVAPGTGELMHMQPKVYAYWLHSFREAHHCAR